MISKAILLQMQKFAIQEGGILFGLSTKEIAINARDTFYAARTSICYDPSKRTLGEFLSDLTAHVEQDITGTTYTLRVFLNPFAASGRVLSGMTSTDCFRMRYNYAREVGLEHLIKEPLEQATLVANAQATPDKTEAFIDAAANAFQKSQKA